MHEGIHQNKSPFRQVLFVPYQRVLLLSLLQIRSAGITIEGKQ